MIIKDPRLTLVSEAKSEEKHLKQSLKDVENAVSNEEKGAKREHHAQSVGPIPHPPSPANQCIMLMTFSLTRKLPVPWPKPSTL